MKKELPYRISKLLTAEISGIIREEERAELRAWREACVENEELYQRVIHGDRFQEYLRLSAEHDYQVKYALLDNKIKRDHRRVLIRRISYAAVIFPFLFLLGWGIQVKFVSELANEKSCIVPGYPRATLTLGGGHVVHLEKMERVRVIDSNVTVAHDTLKYADKTLNKRSEWHTLSVPRGGEFLVALADGTKVWLNSESELKYPVDFTGDERRVFLKGEAYFEVWHDESKPFLVESADQEVRVLGTSFAVQAYPDERAVLTTLEEGWVNVQSGDTRVVLNPGEQSIVQDDTIVVKEVNTRPFTAWREGKFIFINKPLCEIMLTLSRWYDINVFYSSVDLGDIKFTGELIRYSDIEELLRKFEVLEKVRFNVKGKIVVVEKYWK